MAAAAAAASVPLRELDDITECPICAEGLNDARVLPCIHTFCLHCLQDYVKTTKSGAKRACPLCRQEFTVPEGGLTKLPRNYFVEKVIEVKTLTSRLSLENIECDLCIEDKDSPERKPEGKATVFCTDCSRCMCDQCLSYHTRFRTNALHRVIGLNGDIKTEDLLREFSENRCDKHSEETIKLYCFDCKLAVCMMCYVEEHNSHKCSDVSTVADKLMKQLEGDMSDLMNTDKECQKLIKKVKDDEKLFRDTAAKTEKAICEEADKMQKFIERYKDEMLEKLSQVTKERCKQMDTIVQETDLKSIIIRNLVQYGHELKEKGTACDIAKSVNSLRERATELRTLDLKPEYNCKMTFKGCSTYVDVKRVFGNLEFPESNQVRAKQIAERVQHVGLYPLLLTEVDIIRPGKMKLQTAGGKVTGVTALDNDVFVMRLDCHQIEVYDAVNFSFKRHLPLPRRSAVAFPGEDEQRRCLAVCSVYKCLYVSSMTVSCVQKISLPEGNEVGRWQVGRHPWGLSVNNEHNVIVACYGECKLKEFTTNGSLVHEINLGPIVQRFNGKVTRSNLQPVHAVQLTSGIYCVAYQSSSAGFLIADTCGKIIEIFDSDAPMMNANVYGDVQSKFKLPRGLTVDRSHRVFIADQKGNKIFVLHEQRLEVEEVPEAVCGSLNEPYCVHFDPTKGRLYIGEMGGGRVISCTV